MPSIRPIQLCLLAFLALLPLIGLAQENAVDSFIQDSVAPWTNRFVGIIFYSVPIGDTAFPLIVGWLAVAATIFTVYYRGIQFRAFGHALALVRGKYSDPNDAGEVSHFQALTTALSGTVGLGNIAGVAVAVSLGGPGATFWMILVGLLGMSSKFVECTLAVKYRRENPDGSISRRADVHTESRSGRERLRRPRAFSGDSVCNLLCFRLTRRR